MTSMEVRKNHLHHKIEMLSLTKIIPGLEGKIRLSILPIERIL